MYGCLADSQLSLHTHQPALLLIPQHAYNACVVRAPRHVFVSGRRLTGNQASSPKASCIMTQNSGGGEMGRYPNLPSYLPPSFFLFALRNQATQTTHTLGQPAPVWCASWCLSPGPLRNWHTRARVRILPRHRAHFGQLQNITTTRTPTQLTAYTLYSYVPF